MNVTIATGRAPELAASSPFGAARTAQNIVLHRLRTPAQIQSIQSLRNEIDLSVHAATGAAFDLLEKKEMSAASSVGSNWAMNG